MWEGPVETPALFRCLSKVEGAEPPAGIFIARKSLCPRYRSRRMSIAGKAMPGLRGTVTSPILVKPSAV